MNIDALQRRIERLAQSVERVGRAQKSQPISIVFYNPETGAVCPGYEGIAALVRLPDNGRGVYLPEKRRL